MDVLGAYGANGGRKAAARCMVLDTPRSPQIRETENDPWQVANEGGEAGEVLVGGAMVEGSGQVVVANHCCCLMRPQA